ncbi:MAG TPA: ROK family protein [Candidatus Desulfaltia sp.]|nr:ROK family protein [Candidatus Desulfaltia sp.]
MPLFAGFDLGGTQLKYGLLDERLNPAFKDRAPSPPTMGKLMALFRDLWEELKKKERRTIRAVGFGFPGIFSLREQKFIQSPNYPSLDGSLLRPAMARFVEVPFWIDNEANLAAYGEYRCGAGKGVRHLMLITLGTGVGSGIIIDEKILRGSCGYAAEMGHMTVHPDGERCRCGSHGCLETEASAGAIIRNYRRLTRSPESLTAEDIAARARKGDAAARRSFERAGFYLGIGLGIALNMFNPEKILLGGGVMDSDDLILPPAIAEAGRRAYRASFACSTIEKAALGNDAGFIGAAAWARDMFARNRGRSPRGHPLHQPGFAIVGSKGVPLGSVPRPEVDDMAGELHNKR